MPRLERTLSLIRFRTQKRVVKVVRQSGEISSSQASAIGYWGKHLKNMRLAIARQMGPTEIISEVAAVLY